MPAGRRRPTVGPAANLGAPVNTPLKEADPFLAADGLTLLFSRSGADGNFDLWMARRPTPGAPGASRRTSAPLSTAAGPTAGPACRPTG